MKPLTWSTRNHQPLHAVVITLNDLLQTPTSAYADRARHVIDIIFALTGRQGGLIAGSDYNAGSAKRPLSNGGSEAWNYLRRLRAKAWRAANIGPDLRLSRREAIELCVIEYASVNNYPDNSSQPPHEKVQGHQQGDRAVDSNILNFEDFPLDENLFYPSGLNWMDLELEGFLGNDQQPDFFNDTIS